VAENLGFLLKWNRLAAFVTVVVCEFVKDVQIGSAYTNCAHMDHDVSGPMVGAGISLISNFATSSRSKAFIRLYPLLVEEAS